MGAATPALLTFEEFERMPEKPGKQELIHGGLFESPPAEYSHNRISGRLFRQLAAALDAAQPKTPLPNSAKFAWGWATN